MGFPLSITMNLLFRKGCHSSSKAAIKSTSTWSFPRKIQRAYSIHVQANPSPMIARSFRLSARERTKGLETSRSFFPRSSRPMSSGGVSQLLAQVNENTQKFLQYFSSQQLPEPSYDKGDGLDPSRPLPKDVAEARDAAIEAADELHHLLLGPLGLLFRSGDEVSRFSTSTWSATSI